MINGNEKLKKWRKKDFARIITYFAIHTAIIMVLFVFALFLSVDFELTGAWQFTVHGGAGVPVYLAISICLLSGGIFL